MPEQEAPQTAEAGETKTFTQAELDAIVGDRLKRQKSQFADYDDLKAKAAKLEEFEKSQQTEAEKAAQARADAEKRATDLEAALRHKTVESALITAAAGKLADPKDAVLYLGDKLELDETGQVDPTAVAQLVDGLLSEREYLAAKTSDGRPAVPRPNTAQGTSGTPATADPAQQFASILSSRLQGA
jgi:hypothetical protein